MKSTICLILAILAIVSLAAGKELPNAPEPATPTSSSMSAMPSAPRDGFRPLSMEGRILDKKFVTLAVISTGATFADSYTTLFARENWLAHKQGVCNAEVESAYLYGTHPTIARAYAVASVKSAGSAFAAYYLRKHHSRLWSLPLMANSIIGAQGIAQNVVNCK
jgi:hypothetical protein